MNIFGDPPDPVWLRHAFFPAGTEFPAQCRSWGRLLYAVAGVAEFDIGGVRFMSPPGYAIWIPPNIVHSARAALDIHYVVIHLAGSVCADMPDRPCTLQTSRVLTVLVNDLTSRGIGHPVDVIDLKMTDLIVDQLIKAKRYPSYLPMTDDPLLRSTVEFLERNPGDRRSLASWAKNLGSTERTVSRRWQSRMFMSYNEWRQRLKLVKASEMLQSGAQVKAISLYLGFSNTSAFISMYKRRTGSTPGKSKVDEPSY